MCSVISAVYEIVTNVTVVKLVPIVSAVYEIVTNVKDRAFVHIAYAIYEILTDGTYFTEMTWSTRCMRRLSK